MNAPCDWNNTHAFSIGPRVFIARMRSDLSFSLWCLGKGVHVVRLAILNRRIRGKYASMRQAVMAGGQSFCVET